MRYMAETNIYCLLFSIFSYPWKLYFILFCSLIEHSQCPEFGFGRLSPFLTVRSPKSISSFSLKSRSHQNITWLSEIPNTEVTVTASTRSVKGVFNELCPQLCWGVPGFHPASIIFSLSSAAADFVQSPLVPGKLCFVTTWWQMSPQSQYR